MKKICCHCKRELPYINFYKNKSKPDGYRDECKDCSKIYSRNYLKNHPPKRNNKEFFHSFSYSEWIKKLEESNGFCNICNKHVGINNLTQDHNPPISLVKNGYTYNINQVEPVCRSCNSSKGNRISNDEISLIQNEVENDTYISPFELFKYGKFIKDSEEYKHDINLRETERNFYRYCQNCGCILDDFNEENSDLNGISSFLCYECGNKIKRKCKIYEKRKLE